MKYVLLLANHNFRQNNRMAIDDAVQKMLDKLKNGRTFRFNCFTFLDINGSFTVQSPIKNQRFTWRATGYLALKRAIVRVDTAIFVEQVTFDFDRLREFIPAKTPVTEFPRNSTSAEIVKMLTKALK
jgi:hypothetical protein